MSRPKPPTPRPLVGEVPANAVYIIAGISRADATDARLSGEARELPGRPDLGRCVVLRVGRTSVQGTEVWVVRERPSAAPTRLPDELHLPALSPAIPSPTPPVRLTPQHLDFGPDEASALRRQIDAVAALSQRTAEEIEALQRLCAAIPADLHEEVPVSLVACLLGAINRGAHEAVARSRGAR